MLDGGLVHHYEQRRDTSSNAAARRDAERVLEDLRSLCRSAQVFHQEHGPSASLRDFLDMQKQMGQLQAAMSLVEGHANFMAAKLADPGTQAVHDRLLAH